VVCEDVTELAQDTIQQWSFL